MNPYSHLKRKYEDNRLSEINKLIETNKKEIQSFQSLVNHFQLNKSVEQIEKESDNLIGPAKALYKQIYKLLLNNFTFLEEEAVELNNQKKVIENDMKRIKGGKRKK